MASTTTERAAELAENLKDVRRRVHDARGHSAQREPTLVAVSKLKPSSDILACYEEGQRDFGENYVQELVDKAKELPQDIRWHFIGSLQTNKSKLLTSIPNLYCMQTLSSVKAADALNKSLQSQGETSPLNVLLQVNTSGEDSKSGVPSLTEESENSTQLRELAEHIIEHCPRLHLQGLMTIGSISESLSHSGENHDFETLKRTRDLLKEHLKGKFSEGNQPGRWGESGDLLLSMGMSSDFEVALKSGSDIVRVGTGIFGQRPKKEQN